MKETRPPLEIVRPCSMDWAAMSGDARKRFCEGCQKHVFNLSAMTEKEARVFAEETQGRECIAYVPTAHGGIHTPNRFERSLLWIFGRIPKMAALLTFLLPAALCASVERTLGKPAPPQNPPTRDGADKGKPPQPQPPEAPKNPVKPGRAAPPPKPPVVIPGGPGRFVLGEPPALPPAMVKGKVAPAKAAEK